MNRDRKNIDKLFEQGLKGYKEPPPVYTWDRLDAGLGKKGRRKTFFYLRLLAASIIILFAFGAGYFYAVYNTNSDSPGKLSENKNVEQPVHQPSTPEITNIMADDTKESIASVQSPGNDTDNNIANIAEVEPTNSGSSGNIPSIENNDNLLFSDNSSSVEIENTRVHKLEMKQILFIPVEKEESSGLLAISYLKKEAERFDYYNIESAPLREFGYNDNSKNSSDYRWTIGAQVAPINSYRDISITYANGSIADEQAYNNSEAPITSIAAGLDVNYSVSKKFSFQTGMYYSKIGQVNNDALSYVEEDGKFLLYSIETSLGDIDFRLESVPANIREVVDAKDTIDMIDQLNIKVIEDFDVVEVPLMLRYKILDKKFSINMMGGISPAFVTKNNAYLEVDTYKYDVENSANINTVYFNSSLSLGLEYSFVKKLSVNFEPTFKYALSPINKDGKFDYHPYSISWFTGIKFRF